MEYSFKLFLVSSSRTKLQVSLLHKIAVTQNDPTDKFKNTSADIFGK